MSTSSLIENLFQRTLEDLIKGLKLQLIPEPTFISKSLEDIRKEIKSTDLQTKSIALTKLTYLNALYGVDVSWAAFHAIECMSSPKFSEKRIGYVASTQSFDEHTQVLLLIVNQLRKDLNSVNEFEVSLALDCLGRIGSTDLARDLTNEVFMLLGSSKVFVRKKAIGVVFKVFEKYPDSVRVCFKRLVENLESSESGVVSAAVGVFCELAAKDARSYLPLAPEFYKILVDSKNNWIIIKVLKIFAKSAPLEPRLAKRLVEPICDHMRRTGAKSLLFECIRTVVSSFSEYESAVKLAVAKVREFLMDDDPNLKFLGLHALALLAPKHSWAVLENKEVVIKSLSDADSNIKFASLKLVMAMVSEDNIVEISRVLLNYALKSDPEFCNEILGSILSTCFRNVYEIIVDFDWYVSLLGEMSRITHCQKGEEIEYQLIDIGMRVRDVRLQLVHVCRALLIDPALLGNPFMHRILCAAAWISGEYIEYSKNPFELVEALVQPRTRMLPPSIRAVYLQSLFKILLFSAHSYLLQRENISNLEVKASNAETDKSPFENEKNKSSSPDLLSQTLEDLCIENNENVINGLTHGSFAKLLNLVEVALKPLTGCQEVEVKERASNVLGLLEMIKQELPAHPCEYKETLEGDKTEISKFIMSMIDAFSEELGPVSMTAQEKVSLPDGLSLVENLSDLDVICGDLQLPSSSSFFFGGSPFVERMDVPLSGMPSKEDSEQSSESTSLLTEHRKRHGLYYLPSDKMDDYPPANDPILGDNDKDGSDDFVKLTAQSLFPKKKSNIAKPRPVVVKLDEGDAIPVVSYKAEMRNDSLSGAVRDALLSSDAACQVERSGESSSAVKGKEKANTDSPLVLKGNLSDGGNSRHGKSSSRKHRKHSKDRRHRGQEEVGNENDDNIEKAKQKKSSHCRGKHKSRQKEENTTKAVAQTPVIPDFLL